MSSAAPAADPFSADEDRAFAEAFEHELAARSDPQTTAGRLYAAASALRQLLNRRWAATQARDAARPDGLRRVHYLSMEFLLGRALRNAVDALGLQPALGALLPPAAWLDLLEAEPDAALGNGGLGRLAACFLDSLATLGQPTYGYGLFYRYGMFAQRIADGHQVEAPDRWLERGARAFIQPRPELRYRVAFGGHVHPAGAPQRWTPAQAVVAVAHDLVIPGHGTEHVATLRLWQAEAERAIDLRHFNRGEHAAAGAHLLDADTLNWVLYPDDSSAAGHRLRLKQEYLLVSAAVQDMLARHVHERGAVETFGRHNALHLNDTHPALAPVELMRLLIDEHGLPFENAWRITTEATSWTNHTLLPEALESWPVTLLGELLPRHMELVYEINHRFLDEVRAACPDDEGLVQRVSLIDERGQRHVRMASLAALASRRVNGVSALHSQLMVDTLFADFARLRPGRFVNVTNGITPRRWLLQANPALADMLDRRIGSGWRRDLQQLQPLRAQADDPALGRALAEVKRANKVALAERIRRELGLVVDPGSLFDVHAKRIHEYKRQLLNLLQVVARWQAIVAEPNRDWVPRTVIFAGKAASAYHAAKQIIALIHDVARRVNSDPVVRERLKVVFLPDYGVSLAELLIPAADLSQQISTAGTEASGTGNMKFALNGALTIATWDGANIEMARSMGEAQMFVFGLRSEEVAQRRALGEDPSLHAEQDLRLRAVLEAVSGGMAQHHGEGERHRALVQGLLRHDPYFVLADFADYLRAQAEVDALFRSPAAWQARVARNIAGMGPFSIDRTVGEYLKQAWGPIAA